MKKLTTIVLLIAFIPISTIAAEPGGWNLGLFAGETGAAIGLGAVTGLGLGFIRVSSFQGDFIEEAVNLVLLGNGLGSAAGTLLVGELFGATSDNEVTTYLGTTGVALGTAGLFLGVVHSINWDENNDAANIVAYSSLLVTPVTTAILYNVIKKPKTGGKTATDLGFDLRPTTGYLADSGGKYTPVYGVEVGF